VLLCSPGILLRVGASSVDEKRASRWSLIRP
jgi:hypothetical protein